MRFPARAAVAACVAFAAFAASPALAQVAQTPPQSNSPSAADSTPPGSTSAPAVPLFVGNASLVPGWSFAVAPYGWLASVNSRINIPTRGGDVVTEDVHVPFEDLLHHLRFVVALAGEARYDRFSVFSDVLYMNLGLGRGAAHLTSVTGPLGRIDIPVGVQTSSSTGLGATVWTSAGGYTLAAGGWGNIDAIAGARLFAIDFTSNYSLTGAINWPNTATTALARSGSLNANVDYWDGIVGTRGRFDIPNSNFYVPFYLDVGTGAIHLTWQAFTGLAYHSSWGDYSLGYRYLDFEANGSRRVQDMRMGGPMLAATFHF
jgi:hypothetical protein